MKKLLALILCVMMFVAVIPTAAFAADAEAWKVVGDNSGWYAASVNKQAISDLEDAIDNMYNALAANQLVFGTAQTLHTMADDLVKSLLADVDDFTYGKGENERTVDHDDLVTNSRKFLKTVIGGYITDYVTTRQNAYTNTDGTVDYEKYIKVYTNAVNNSLTSAKAQKGIEAFVYSLAALKLQDVVNDAHDDLKDAILDWNDYGSKWAEFGFKLPATADDLTKLWDNLDGKTPPTSTFVAKDGLTDAESATLIGILDPAGAAAAAAATTEEG